jgi:hypothetical protein
MKKLGEKENRREGNKQRMKQEDTGRSGKR